MEFFLRKFKHNTWIKFRPYLMSEIFSLLFLAFIFIFPIYYFNLSSPFVVGAILFVSFFIYKTIKNLLSYWKFSKYLASLSFEFYGIKDTDNIDDWNHDLFIYKFLLENLDFGFKGGKTEERTLKSHIIEFSNYIHFRLTKIHPKFRWAFLEELCKHNFNLSTYKTIQPLGDTFLSEDIPKIENIFIANKEKREQIFDLITFISVINNSNNHNKEALIKEMFTYFSRKIPDFIDISKTMDIPFVDKGEFERLLLSYELSLKEFDNTKNNVRKI